MNTLPFKFMGSTPMGGPGFLQYSIPSTPPLVESFFSINHNIFSTNEHFLVYLSGTNTVWDDNTIFSISGATLTHQKVFSETSAMVSIIPGLILGNVSIDDGNYTLMISKGFNLYNTKFIVNDLPGYVISLGK